MRSLNMRNTDLRPCACCCRAACSSNMPWFVPIWKGHENVGLDHIIYNTISIYYIIYKAFLILYIILYLLHDRFTEVNNIALALS